MISQAPSPSERALAGSTARAAAQRRVAQASVSAWLALEKSGHSLVKSHAAIRASPANCFAIVRTSNSLARKIGSSLHQLRPAHQSGSQFSPDMCPTKKVGIDQSPCSAASAIIEPRRSCASGRTASGVGKKSGVKQNTRTTLQPSAASCWNSALTSSGSHGSRYIHGPWDPDEVSAEFQQLAALGCNVVRVFCFTPDFLPTPEAVRPEAQERLGSMIALAA